VRGTTQRGGYWEEGGQRRQKRDRGGRGAGRTRTKSRGGSRRKKRKERGWNKHTQHCRGRGQKEGGRVEEQFSENFKRGVLKKGRIGDSERLNQMNSNSE